MKRILSLVLVLVILASVFAGLSLPAAAANPIDVQQKVELTAGQEPSGTFGRVYLSDYLEKYTNVSPLDDITFRYGDLPDGMDWSTNDAREFYLKGTPTNPGVFYSYFYIDLEDGTRLDYTLSVTVKATRVIESSQNVTFNLDVKPTSYSLDVDKYRASGVSYEIRQIAVDDMPPGMKWSFGEPDAPYLYDAPTAAGTFHPKWRIVLDDGTLINHTLNITVVPKKTVTSSQYVSLKASEDPGRVKIDIGDKKTDFVKYCHLVEGELPWPMQWSYGGEPDLPYIHETPRISGEFPTVWELTLYDGTLVRHTMNINVEPTKVIISSQMMSLTIGEDVKAEFDVYKYKTDGYVSCRLLEGEIPPGLDYMYGEVSTPYFYGVVGQSVPTRAKEQFEREDVSGTYVSKWQICLYDGTQINHTINAVVTKDGNPFKDVKADDYFFKPVLWAVTHEPQVTNGVDLTHFGPGKTCTRGQVVTFLWRAMGCPEPKVTKNPFTDVKESDYFYQPVLWAVGEGITKGMSETSFGAASACTRGQVVTFLWRAEGEPAPASSNNPFKDVKATDYFYAPVLWAVEQGITNGTSPTKFSPNATCTRGQIATFLYRDLAPVNILSKADLLMYVEDVMTITGRGVVFTGRVASGKVSVGDKIRVIGSKDGEPKDETFTVEGIEMFHRTVDYAEAGDNVGILVGNVDKALIERGDAMVGAKSDLVPVTKLKGQLELFTKYDGGRSTPIYDTYKPQIYIGTTDVTGTITGLKDGGPLMPGEKASNVSIELINPTFCYIGQEVTIREAGRTLGTFIIQDIEK